jgi:hypothetical protein
MTKREKQWLSKVADLGCLICGAPAEIHHIRTGQGMGQRASNFLVIPLCEFHHRLGAFGEAIHAGQREFEIQHGCNELDLLAEVIRRLS